MSWFDLTRPPAAHVAPRVLKTEKRCPRCGGCYPISAFNFRKAARDGLQTYCKACMLLSSKESLARKAQRLKDRPPVGSEGRP